MNESWTEDAILEHITEKYGLNLSPEGEGWKISPRITWSSNYGYSYRRSRDLSKAKLSFRMWGTDIDDGTIRGQLSVDKLTGAKLTKKIDDLIDTAEKQAKRNREIKEHQDNSLQDAQQALDVFCKINDLPQLEAKQTGRFSGDYTAYLGWESLFKFTTKKVVGDIGTERCVIKNVKFSDYVPFPDVIGVCVSITRDAARKEERRKAI